MENLRRVFLVGYMGSGKSTIGKHLAADMGWQFVDMDEVFEKQHNTTISDFFATNGEEAFRKAEAEIVSQMCEEQNVVIATGGGAPCHFDNVERMRNAGLVIYIYVEPVVLARRLQNARASRPLLANKTVQELEAHIAAQLAERDKFYRQAQMTVDGDRLPFSAYKMFVDAFEQSNTL